MVNQLGRHSFNIEALMGKDLDHLAEVITGTLHEVHEGQQPVVEAQPGPGGAADSRGDKEGNREPLAAVQLNRDQDLKSDKGQDLNQRMKQQGMHFFCWEREHKLAMFGVVMCLFFVIDVRV